MNKENQNLQRKHNRQVGLIDSDHQSAQEKTCKQRTNGSVVCQKACGKTCEEKCQHVIRGREAVGKGCCQNRKNSKAGAQKKPEQTRGDVQSENHQIRGERKEQK